MDETEAAHLTSICSAALTKCLVHVSDFNPHTSNSKTYLNKRKPRLSLLMVSRRGSAELRTGQKVVTL
jgi:hypothetical protein